MVRPGCSVALAVLAATLAAPGIAHADAPPLARGLSDAAYFNAENPVRALGIARTKRAGAQLARVQLSWRYILRITPTTSAEARSPDWKGYKFDYVDRVLRDLAAAGVEPLVVIKSAPAAFEAQPRWRFARIGTWAPDPGAYGDFAVAAAQRYSGRFLDPERPGATLPRVRYWQAWNEPNLPQYLQPQWVARGPRWVPFAPTHYRRMLNAFSDGVKSVLADNVVVTAGTAPLGEPDGVGRMAPVRFWQSFFCLGAPPGLTPGPCPDPARFDIFAHHPFSVWDPDSASRPPLSGAVADLHRLLELLRAAERTGRAPRARRHQVWVTELNWDTRPPDSRGLPAALQRRWIPRALYRLSAEGVSAVFWHFISDPPDRSHPAGLWQRSAAGPAQDRPKPALAAFRFPFVVNRTSEARVRVWGLLPSSGPRRAVVERRRNGRWRRVASVGVTARGVLAGSVALRGAATLRARVGTQRSPAWRVGPG